MPEKGRAGASLSSVNTGGKMSMICGIEPFLFKKQRGKMIDIIAALETVLKAGRISLNVKHPHESGNGNQGRLSDTPFYM